MTTAGTARAVSTFYTTIGSKLVMALTGVFLMIFLILHLSGNFLLLSGDGGAAFDAYAQFMSTNPLIRASEFILAAGFLIHIIQGLSLAAKNNKSRNKRYKVATKSPASAFSKIMVVSGSIVLIFLLIHLYQFWFQHRFIEEEGASMYATTRQTLAHPAFSIIYIAGIITLCFHLIHGFQSAFQSLGLQVNQRIKNRLTIAGYIYAVAICLGFITIPIYFMITGA